MKQTAQVFRLFTILLLGLFLVGLVSATSCDSSGFRGTFQKSTEFSVGVSCPTCTYINWTITSPNGIITEQQAQVQGSYFYYEFNTTQSEEVGTYFMDGLSNLDTPVGICFEVTKTGDIVETSESLMYIIILIFISLFLAGGVYISIVTPYENLGEMTRDGEAITKVTKSKYVKIMATWFSYGLFLTLITILAGMTNNYIQFEEMKNMFTASYLFLSVLGYGISVLSIWLIFYNIWKDIILNKTILREGKALLKEL